MLTFLFWNIKGQSLEASIGRLAITHAVDVLILAECHIEPGLMLRMLNAPGANGGYTYPSSESERLHVYTRLPSEAIEALHDGSRFSARRLRPPDGDEVLLIAAHLRSKLYQSSDSQQFAGVDFARDIAEMEGKVAHQRTVVVGDLNMNPFEPGVVAANGLHAVTAKQIARQVAREVGGTRYAFFYNPTWTCFGERDARPPGTYYLRRAEHVCYFWNVFDQVLVRPALVDAFIGDSLAVLAHDGEESLLRANQEGVEVPHPSDHLPLLFSLRLAREDHANAPD